MEVSCHLHTSVVSTPGKQPTILTGYDAGCGPKSVWMQRRREK